MTLTEKLASIKLEIGAVAKGSTMTDGPAYKYRGIDSILDAAHASLILHQVTIWPVDAVATYETRNNGRAQWVSLKVTWGVRSGSEVLQGCSVGEAIDYSDKASNKAHTAAFKVFLSQLFAIPYSTDDPDDHRPEIIPTDRISVELHAALLARLRALPADVQEAIKPLVAAGPRLSEMTADQTGEAEVFIDLLEAEVSDAAT